MEPAKAPEKALAVSNALNTAEGGLAPGLHAAAVEAPCPRATQPGLLVARATAEVHVVDRASTPSM